MNPPATDVILTEESVRLFQFCVLRYNPDRQSNVFRHPDTDAFQVVRLLYPGTLRFIAGGIGPILNIPDTAAPGIPNRQEADQRINTIAAILLYQYQQQIASSCFDTPQNLQVVGTDITGQWDKIGNVYIPDVVTELRDQYTANPAITTALADGAAPLLRQKLAAMNITANHIEDLIDVLLDNMRRNFAGGYTLQQLRADVLAWMVASGLQAVWGDDAVAKAWDDICGQIPPDALLRPEVISHAIQECISAAIYTHPMNAVIPQWVQKRRTEADKAVLRRFLVNHWSQPDDLDARDNLNPALGQAFWHSHPQILVNRDADVMPIVTPATRDPATQQHLMWKVLGEVSYIKNPQNPLAITAAMAGNTLRWILSNIEIKRPVNPMETKETAIKRFLKLLGGKVYKERKQQTIAWFALDNLHLVDPRNGFFTRAQQEALVKQIAASIPVHIPYRWPWFPMSRDARENHISLRWLFEGRSEAQCTRVAKVAWDIPDIRKIYDAPGGGGAAGGHMWELYNTAPTITTRIDAILAASGRDGTLQKRVNETTRLMMGPAVICEHMPMDRFFLYPLNAWQEQMYMVQIQQDVDMLKDTLECIRDVVTAGLRLYSQAATERPDGCRARIDISAIFDGVSAAVNGIPAPLDASGNPRAKEPGDIILAQVGGSIVPAGALGLMTHRLFRTGGDLMQTDQDLFEALIQDPQQLMDKTVNIVQLPDTDPTKPAELDKLVNVELFIRAIARQMALGRLDDVFKASCLNARFVDRSIASLYERCYLLSPVVLTVIERLTANRQPRPPMAFLPEQERRAGNRFLLNFVGVFSIPNDQLREIQRSLHPVRDAGAVSQIQTTIAQRVASNGFIQNPLDTLRRGPGRENIAHKFNIDIYQEGFAQYRSTLLYYERLDALDIAALMSNLETPLDPTKIGHNSDMVDLYDRMDTFVNQGLIIQESIAPNISILIRNFKNNSLQSILNQQDQEYSDKWKTGQLPITFLAGKSIYRSPVFYVDDQLMRLKLDWIIAFINTGSISLIPFFGNNFRFAAIPGGISAAMCAQFMKQISTGSFMDALHQKNMADLCAILSKPLERVSHLQQESRQFNVLYATSHLIDLYSEVDPDSILKMIEDAKQPVFGTGNALNGNQKNEVSDMMAVRGATVDKQVKALEKRIKGSGASYSYGMFAMKSILGHLLYRDLLAILACIIGVYWNPRFDPEIAQIVATEAANKYYSLRGIDLPLAIDKVKRLGIDMAVKDAVKTANAAGQLDKIVADIIDPGSQRVKDVVEGIWRHALISIP